jgi:hypothetical protein
MFAVSCQLIAQRPIDIRRIAAPEGHVDGNKLSIGALERANGREDLAVQRSRNFGFGISSRFKIDIHHVARHRFFEHLGLKRPDGDVNRCQKAQRRQCQHQYQGDGRVAEPFGGKKRTGPGFQGFFPVPLPLIQRRK